MPGAKLPSHPGLHALLRQVPYATPRSHLEGSGSYVVIMILLGLCYLLPAQPLYCSGQPVLS